jgi:hypothetical protein
MSELHVNREVDDNQNLLNVTWICPKINARHSFHDGIVDTVQEIVGGLACVT